MGCGSSSTLLGGDGQFDDSAQSARNKNNKLQRGGADDDFFEVEET